MTTSELLTEPIPDELFHYTNTDGLRGILSSHSMYATDSLFLNDTTELANALPTARSVLTEFPFPPMTSPKTLHGLLEEEHSSGFLSPSKAQYFLLSFSTAGDDLQQWRGYGDDTHGVCIGFDLSHIRPPHWMDTMVTFARCLYLQAEKTDLMNSLASAFCERDLDLSAAANNPRVMAMEWALWQMDHPDGTRSHFMLDYKHKLKSQIEYSLTCFRSDLVRLSCHFKSSHFSSEREWRLVLPHVRAEQFKKTVIHVRGGRPCVAFSFEGYDKLPITSIRLGANADRPLVETILSETGYAVTLKDSEIPYRSFRSK